MKIYQCANCQYPVYVNNISCENCRSPLGYSLAEDRMIALTQDGSKAESADLRYCGNYQYNVCNWLIPAAGPADLCEACALNHIVPDHDSPAHLREWRRLEVAKHRLVYALRRLGLPFSNRMASKRNPLEFEFIAKGNDGNPALTGHYSGLITINIAEADPVHREATRIQMKERYRTLIGHFRHEVGHYYWDVLIANNEARLAEFRQLFGDDRENYQEALERHYKNGAPPNWSEKYISKYAATHAWEDWAETWAHYLHLLDMLETAHSFGVSVKPAMAPEQMMSMSATFDPYQEPNMARIIAACIPLTFAANMLNRGMGRKDLYPFVINAAVREKLAFVHKVVRAGVPVS